jgi:hypothetical protein
MPGHGWFLGFLRVPDSPDTAYRPVPGDVYVGGTGVASFGSNGGFKVVCSGETFYHGAASEKEYGFPCRLYRGGQDFTFVGSTVYAGTGFVRVGPVYTNSAGTQFVHAVMGCSGRLQRP